MPQGLDHRALLYDGVDHVVAAAGAYVREGLERGEPVWMITGTPQMDAVLRSLGRDAANVDTTAMEAWYGTPARTLTMLTRRLSERYGDARPRALGEIPLAGASPGAQRDWLRL